MSPIVNVKMSNVQTSNTLKPSSVKQNVDRLIQRLLAHLEQRYLGIPNSPSSTITNHKSPLSIVADAEVKPVSSNAQQQSKHIPTSSRSKLAHLVNNLEVPSVNIVNAFRHNVTNIVHILNFTTNLHLFPSIAETSLSSSLKTRRSLNPRDSSLPQISAKYHIPFSCICAASSSASIMFFFGYSLSNQSHRTQQKSREPVYRLLRHRQQLLNEQDTDTSNRSLSTISTASPLQKTN